MLSPDIGSTPGSEGRGMAEKDLLARKVAKLIEAAGDPSYETLAQEIKDLGGPTVSGTYLWQLRTGKRDNPTFQHLTALAHYFSTKLSLPITLSYFDPQTPVNQPWIDARTPQRSMSVGQQSAQEERELVEQLARRGIQRISARYGEAGTGMFRDILEIMDSITTAEAADQHSGPEQQGPPDHR